MSGGVEFLQKRSWPEITVDILEVTLHPANKMKIMYGSNLNFDRFNKYFYGLLEKGFIEEINDSAERGYYKITQRGKTLLDVIRKAQDLLNSQDY